jgi:hypothetical protein
MILIKHLSGSRLYDLQNENSDTDYRGVFVNTNVLNILNIKKSKSTLISEDEVDSVFWELSHFLKMVLKGNTQSLETLFSPKDSWIECHSVFEECILKNREHFLDTKSIFNSIIGHSVGEERKTFICHEKNEKRNDSIKENGYSHKNAVQCLRLMRCNRLFLQRKVFYTSLKTVDPSFHNLLWDIKNSPDRFNVNFVKALIEEERGYLLSEFNERDKNKDFVFSEEIAIQSLKKIYGTFFS